MIFLALHDDVKFIIATHLASDLKIRTLLSKNHDIRIYIYIYIYSRLRRLSIG